MWRNKTPQLLLPLIFQKILIIKPKEILSCRRNSKSKLIVQNCAAKIEDAVKKLPGVNSASVSFMAQKMVLDVDDDKFDAVLKDVVKTAKRVEPDFEIEL